MKKVVLQFEINVHLPNESRCTAYFYFAPNLQNRFGSLVPTEKPQEREVGDIYTVAEEPPPSGYVALKCATTIK